MSKQKRGKYKRWTDSEVKFIKENINKMSTSTMSKHLDRNESVVKMKIKNLGLKRDKNSPEYKEREGIWQEYEIEYILENYGILSNYEIGKALNRAANAVECKARDLRREKKLPPLPRKLALGMPRKKKVHPPLTEDELSFIKASIFHMKYTEIAFHLERPQRFIRDKLKELGLNVPKHFWKNDDNLVVLISMHPAFSFKDIADFLGTKEEYCRVRYSCLTEKEKIEILKRVREKNKEEKENGKQQNI